MPRLEPVTIATFGCGSSACGDAILSTLSYETDRCQVLYDLEEVWVYVKPWWCLEGESRSAEDVGLVSSRGFY